MAQATTLERLFEPGTSAFTFALFNVTVLSLLGFVSYLYYSGVANIHALVLSFLAVGLLASVNLLVFAVGLDGGGGVEPKVTAEETKKDS
jgi:hypothetical protein